MANTSSSSINLIDLDFFSLKTNMLETVNRLFLESTEPHNFATLFYSHYDPGSRRLRYVSCGHNPALLVRASGNVDRLEASATVLGVFRNWAARHVELVNHARDGIPEEQVRYHLCWGSWEGPHSADLPLHEVIDLLLGVKASQYSFEAANPQHEHEWQDWEKVRLPPGRALIPGVVTHKTTVLEHPETVAQRLMRYALIVGKENVIAGTDCGLGGRIHPELAWAKLRALAEGAALASERLW